MMKHQHSWLTRAAAAPIQTSLVFVALALLLLAAAPTANAATFIRLQGVTTHRVRSGETLSGIASRYGVTTQAIMRYNGLTDYLIVPGQTSHIPSGKDISPPPANPSPASSGYHVVQAGETLGSIASRYGISLTALKQANSLTGDIIYIGQALRIPQAKVNPTRPKTASTYNANSRSSNASASTTSPCGASYTVQRGDTLSAIAARCGVSTQALVSANGLISNVIWNGQSLTIPK